MEILNSPIAVSFAVRLYKAQITHSIRGICGHSYFTRFRLLRSKSRSVCPLWNW